MCESSRQGNEIKKKCSSLLPLPYQPPHATCTAWTVNDVPLKGPLERPQGFFQLPKKFSRQRCFGKNYVCECSPKGNKIEKKSSLLLPLPYQPPHATCTAWTVNDVPLKDRLERLRLFTAFEKKFR